MPGMVVRVKTGFCSKHRCGSSVGVGPLWRDFSAAEVLWRRRLAGVFCLGFGSTWCRGCFAVAGSLAPQPLL